MLQTARMPGLVASILIYLPRIPFGIGLFLSSEQVTESKSFSVGNLGTVAQSVLSTYILAPPRMLG
mgnify:CR=1 FL=1